MWPEVFLHNLETPVSNMEGANIVKLGKNVISSLQVVGTLVETLNEPPPKEIVKEPRSDSLGFTCIACNITFSNLDEQRLHFHMDFHRYNVQRRLKNQSPITEEEFEKKADQDDLSSIDGSDSEEEEVKIKPRTPFVSFKHPTLPEKMVKIYRPIFSGQKDFDLSGVLDRLSQLQIKDKQDKVLWTMIMLSSGHFAGAVFDVATEKPILHKTFHRYTTRRKQGGSQSANDQSKGKANSAGAQLRRYNEQALAKEIKDLLEAWKPQIDASDLIFISAPSGNQRYLDESGILLNDDRIRSIPFTTKRPTLQELSRCFKELVTVKVEAEKLEPEKGHEKPATPKPPSRPVTPTPAPVKSIPLGVETEKIVDLIKRGKPEILQSKLTPQLILTCHNDLKETTIKDYANTPTLLHFAALMDQPECVKVLLQQSLDPTIQNSKNKTPYELASEKETRNAFRRYRADHEEEWDWKAARVAEPLTQAMEEEQERKLKEKKEKEKAKTKAKKPKKEEEKPVVEPVKPVEKAKPVLLRPIPASARPSQMSAEARAKLEREKRAMAAEWRMRQATNKCVSCGKPLLGLTPFERLAYKYCSMDCLKAHREYLDA